MKTHGRWVIGMALFLIVGVLALRHDIQAADTKLREREQALLKLALDQEVIWSTSGQADRIVIPGRYSVIAEVQPDGTAVYWKDRTYCNLMEGGTIRLAAENTAEDLRLYVYESPMRATDGCLNNIRFRLHNETVDRWARGWRKMLEIDHAISATRRGA